MANTICKQENVEKNCSTLETSFDAIFVIAKVSICPIRSRILPCSTKEALGKRKNEVNTTSQVHTAFI